MTAGATKRQAIPATKSSCSDLAISSVYDQGDVHFHTSDGWDCRVHHVYVCAMSAVFKEAWDMASSTDNHMTIELTYDFEDRLTVQGVLAIATGRGRLIAECTKSSIASYRKMHRFAQKWDCSQPLYMLELYLSHSMVSDPDSLDEVFISAAIMDNASLCAKAIGLSSGGAWTEYTSADGLGVRPNTIFMDPSTWSLENYLICPPLYTWALQRAIDTEQKPESRAEKFLEMVRKYKSLQSEKARDSESV